MLEITSAQLQQWLVTFFWPFTRIAAFVGTAPLLGHSSLPARAKVALAAFLAVIVASTLPPLPPAPLFSWAGLGIIVEQVIVGAALGLCMHIVFAVVMVAGEFIGLQMGLGFATFFSPATGTNTMVLSRIFYMVALLLFMAFNGHLLMIRVLADTFLTLPIGLSGLNAGAFESLAYFSSIVFTSGMLLSLPLVIALLIINLTLGILNRSAPQFTVFSVGFPMSLMTGLFLLVVLMGDFGRFLDGLFIEGLRFMGQLAERFAS